MLEYIESGPGQEVARGSAYWLYNGATSYYHNGVDYKNSEKRFTELMTGTAEVSVGKAYDKLLAYV